MKRIIAMALAALALALSGCAHDLKLDPNYVAALAAWERQEAAKRTPVTVLDLQAVAGKSIENVASIKAQVPGGAPSPPPTYTPPPNLWDKFLAFLTRGAEVAGNTVLGLGIAREAGDVLKAGYSAAGAKTTVGGDYNAGAGSGSDRGNPTTTTSTTGVGE
jgi:hypothetical protein